jgi:hypothetical protein
MMTTPNSKRLKSMAIAHAISAIPLDVQNAEDFLGTWPMSFLVLGAIAASLMSTSQRVIEASNLFSDLTQQH